MSENDESNQNDTSSTPPNANQKPKAKKITIDIPKDLEAVYGNVAFISHTPAEMVIDFAQVLPRMLRGTIKARIIMSPMHAKMLQIALAQNIANFERQFGTITLPQQMSLADQFFRFPTQDPDKDSDDKEE